MCHRIQNVAVIGAGISGVVSSIHLKAAGLDVTVFERSTSAGGVWYAASILFHYLLLEAELSASALHGA